MVNQNFKKVNSVFCVNVGHNVKGITNCIMRGSWGWGSPPPPRLAKFYTFLLFLPAVPLLIIKKGGAAPSSSIWQDPL